MITLSRIEKRFGNNSVLKNINIDIEEGTVTALIGPSGSGKSTLLRCINLLETPRTGTLRIGDEEITFTPGAVIKRREAKKICQQTGMVFQNFALFPHKTVIENVTEGLITVHRWPQDKARERAEALLDKVGMLHKRHAFPDTLSGGQQQRVAIARALAPSPRVLLCDEPTSALDPELSLEVVEVLRRLSLEGATMLLATHDLRLASTIADRVIFLEAGEIVEEGPAKTIFKQAKKFRTAEFVASLTGLYPDSWEI